MDERFYFFGTFSKALLYKLQIEENQEHNIGNILACRTCRVTEARHAVLLLGVTIFWLCQTCPSYRGSPVRS
ncbi:hypothetical protein J6590_054856 [Homalodisca vitripennis]|nr:hypothetical protein J6590_054856 [Homalodisca vitripennis]